MIPLTIDHELHRRGEIPGSGTNHDWHQPRQPSGCLPGRQRQARGWLLPPAGCQGLPGERQWPPLPSDWPAHRQRQGGAQYPGGPGNCKRLDTFVQVFWWPETSISVFTVFTGFTKASFWWLKPLWLESPIAWNFIVHYPPPLPTGWCTSSLAVAQSPRRHCRHVGMSPPAAKSSIAHASGHRCSVARYWHFHGQP